MHGKRELSAKVPPQLSNPNMVIQVDGKSPSFANKEIQDIMQKSYPPSIEKGRMLSGDDFFK